MAEVDKAVSEWQEAEAPEVPSKSIFDIATEDVFFDQDQDEPEIEDEKGQANYEDYVAANKIPEQNSGGHLSFRTS